MRMNNLNKVIRDYKAIFNIKFDRESIDILYKSIGDKCIESCIEENDTFCLEEKKYDGGLCKIIFFKFQLIAKESECVTTNLISGEQFVEHIVEDIVTYLGYN